MKLSTIDNFFNQFNISLNELKQLIKDKMNEFQTLKNEINY